MSEAFTNGQLGEMVKEGFDGVHKRQDVTNGRIKKLELWRAAIAGGMIIVSIFGRIIYTNIIDRLERLEIIVQQK